MYPIVHCSTIYSSWKMEATSLTHSPYHVRLPYFVLGVLENNKKLPYIKGEMCDL